MKQWLVWTYWCLRAGGAATLGRWYIFRNAPGWVVMRFTLLRLEGKHATPLMRAVVGQARAEHRLRMSRLEKMLGELSPQGRLAEDIKWVNTEGEKLLRELEASEANEQPPAPR